MRPEYEQAVRARLGAVHFHVRTRAVRSKVRAVRDDLIAHLVVGTGESGCLAAPKHPGVTLAELKALRDDIVSLFDALSFGCGYHTWVLQYSPQVTHPKDTDARSDVERVLDSVARDSAVFNLPEAEPEYWPIAKAALGAEAVQRLNAYRKRMGFPEA